MAFSFTDPLPDFSAQNNLGVFTVAALPPAADNMDKFAIVTDLQGDRRDKVLATMFAGVAYWVPLRPSYGKALPVATMTLSTLGTPNLVTLTGSIATSVTRNITLSDINAYPGATFEINAKSLVINALGVLNILGTGLGSGISLLSGSYAKFNREPQGWVRFV